VYFVEEGGGRSITDGGGLGSIFTTSLGQGAGAAISVSGSLIQSG
jgi:hypothetical protein